MFIALNCDKRDIYIDNAVILGCLVRQQAKPYSGVTRRHRMRCNMNSNQKTSLVLRALIPAVAVALVVSAALPAAARTVRTAGSPTYDQCVNLAEHRGTQPGTGAGPSWDFEFSRFINECMAGKIPFSER
jgi:hypothetical protein